MGRLLLDGITSALMPDRENITAISNGVAITFSKKFKNKMLDRPEIFFCARLLHGDFIKRPIEIVK